MKMSPRFTKAQANMQPGVITSDGFLGDDTRDIIDIIAADEERCTDLGIDLDEAVRKLRYLFERGRKGLGEPVTVDDTWIVRISEARGHLPSPFEDGIFRKINAEIELAPQGKRSGARLLVGELSIHMIETNHFLQGKGSPFRVEPEELKRVLSR